MKEIKIVAEGRDIPSISLRVDLQAITLISITLVEDGQVLDSKKITLAEPYEKFIVEEITRQKEGKMVKPITINLQDDILDKAEIYAKARGLETEEALKFIIGDGLMGVYKPFIAPIVPRPPEVDPMKLLVNVFAGMGICKCTKCTTVMTSDEIVVNGDQCFKCKPDTRSLEF